MNMTVHAMIMTRRVARRASRAVLLRGGRVSCKEPVVSEAMLIERSFVNPLRRNPHQRTSRSATSLMMPGIITGRF